MNIRPTHVVVSGECKDCGGAGSTEVVSGITRTCKACRGAGYATESMPLEDFAKLFTWGTQQTKDADGAWGILNVLRVAEKKT